MVTSIFQTPRLLNLDGLITSFGRQSAAGKIKIFFIGSRSSLLLILFCTRWRECLRLKTVFWRSEAWLLVQERNTTVAWKLGG